MNDKKQITYEEARTVANEAAREEIKRYLSDGVVECLSDQYIEAEGCWFFFVSEKIELPTENGSLIFRAFAVTKAGEVSCVYDLRPNDQQMRDYVEFFSLTSLGKDAQSKRAWADFSRKYLWKV